MEPAVVTQVGLLVASLEVRRVVPLVSWPGALLVALMTVLWAVLSVALVVGLQEAMLVALLVVTPEVRLGVWLAVRWTGPQTVPLERQQVGSLAMPLVTPLAGHRANSRVGQHCGVK